MRSLRYRQTYMMINNYDWGSKPMSELLGIIGGFSVDTPSSSAYFQL